MGSEEKIPNGWIKLNSKSRPGRFYFYNKEKKISVWNIQDCKNLLKTSSSITSQHKTPKKSPQKQSVKISESSKVIKKKNIAEDRMKKLKRDLALEVTKSGKELAVKKRDSKSNVTHTSSTNDIEENKLKLNNQTSEEDKNSINKDEAVSLGKDSNNKIDLQVESMDIDELSQKTLQPSQDEEPMDWEEIDQNEAVERVLSVRSVERVASVSLNFSEHNKVIQSQESEFVVIVDTNVLLSNLKFIRNIKGMNFKDVGRCVIYIPYIVLCELDRLKMRDEVIARQARSAIRFIESCLSAKDEYMVGQSALESSREIIKIDCGDDYIINSGFQVKSITNKFLILSNDKNLRNKAVVNGMQTYSSDILNCKMQNDSIMNFEFE